MEAEFASCFEDDVDYKYSLARAAADGLVRGLRCFLMPFWPPSELLGSEFSKGLGKSERYHVSEVGWGVRRHL